MNDLDIITCVFVGIDELVNNLALDPEPGPVSQLSLSEVLTIAVLHPLLKPGITLKRFYRWLECNWSCCFPCLVDYSRYTRILRNRGDFLHLVQQKYCENDSFGLIAEGTTVPVMHVVRGPYATSFRDARKVYCASKKQWDWGFLLELVIDQHFRRLERPLGFRRSGKPGQGSTRETVGGKANSYKSYGRQRATVDRECDWCIERQTGLRPYPGKENRVLHYSVNRNTLRL